jgi:hypothetical protein
MLFVTAPPHPAAKARLIISAVRVGGAEASMKGLGKCIPANSTLIFAMISSSALETRHLLDGS